MAPTDWLANGGTYWVLAIQTLLVAAFGVWYGIYVGKLAKAENDGCLLGLMNVVMTLAGAAIGYRFADYPTFIFTSLVGAVTLPALVSAFMTLKMKR